MERRPESEFADCVGALYEAAANGGDWTRVGENLCRLLAAERASLSIGGGPETRRNLLIRPDETESVYSAYFHSLDPYLAKAQVDFVDNRSYHLTRAKTGADLVSEKTFLHSEYYADFARRHGRRHAIGGMLGLTEATPLFLYRGHGAEPFTNDDVRTMQTVLPHLQRALELRARLATENHTVWATRAALDALPVGVAIVDAGLRIHFINDAARKHLTSPSGFCSIASGPRVGNGVYLAAISKQDAVELRRLVASATSGGAGGSMRVSNADMTYCAILVSPAPSGLATDGGNVEPGGLAKNLAMVVIRRLGNAASLSAGLLCDLFDLSTAEAQVAIAMSGGARAEEVARQRGVSLATVRTQIRSILGKSECENLRDLERSMASLAAVLPRNLLDV